ncbi:MAG: PqqD family protein [Deltaproteobacteria bacterium]|nr:PqqD family protein [Deltaproteobacteria bacterium]MCB9788121.1 PqqD family protein [Deltaproteobacteria bacterium]
MSGPGGPGPDERLAVVDGHIERRVGPLCFVLAPDGQMHSFDNEAAVAVWDGLALAGTQGTTPRALALRLTERFEVGEAEALEDVRGVLASLLSHCVVRRVG